MKRKLKNLLCFTVAFIVIMCSLNVTFAAGKQSQPQSKGTFAVKLIPSKDKITPSKTFYGDGGTSSLDYIPYSGGFSWDINVTDPLPLVFTGSLDIYTSSGTYKGTLYLEGEGPGYASGTAYLSNAFPPISLKRGSYYLAKFSGSAVNTDGTSFSVVSGAQLYFTY